MSPCRHPIRIDVNMAQPFLAPVWWRLCAICGLGYDRSFRILDPLCEQIRARHRLPVSPWTAAERAVDCS